MRRLNTPVTRGEYDYFQQEVVALKRWAARLRDELSYRYGSRANALQSADQVVKKCDKLADFLYLRFRTEFRLGLKSASSSSFPFGAEYPARPLTRDEHVALGTEITNRTKVWTRLGVRISQRCSRPSPVGRGAIRLSRAIEDLRNQLDNQAARDLRGQNIDLYYY